MGDFSHLNATGEAAMVRLGAKVSTARKAVVAGAVRVSELCVAKLTHDAAVEIIRTARLAGIQGAKQTAHLVPLCHPIPLTGIDIDITFDRGNGAFAIKTTTETEAPTGVEMEALCGAMVAAVTIYDMVKAVDPAAVIESMQLMEKRGGKHGAWVRA